MPLDDTTSTSAPPVVKIDTSSSLGNALGAGPTPGEIAKAKTDQTAYQTDLKAAGSELVSSEERARDATHAAMLQKPPLPPPTPPPTQQPTNPVEAWGSLAMSMAMLGSAFTRRPLLNSLNAAADVMKAYKQRDVDAYKTAFDQWKAQSDYSLKLYEYQHEAYKDALEMIATDSKGAMALFRARAAALGDSPMQQLADANKPAELVSLVNERDARAKDMATKNSAATTQGNLSQAALEAGNVMRADPTNPEKQQAYKDAVQAARDFSITQHPTLMTGELLAGKEYEITDKDGHLVRKVLGRSDKNDPSRVFEEGTGKPIVLEPGQQLHATTPGAGRQQAAQLTALRGSGNEAVAALKNLVELPITANAGALMGVQFQTPNEMGEALKRSLAREFTSDESKALYISFAGLGRSLATLEAQGRAQGLVGLANQMDRLMPQTGDKPITIMRRYAEVRQIIDRAMENAKVSGEAAPSTIELYDKIAAEAKEAVPFTVHDVNTLEFGGENGVRDFANKLFADRQGNHAELPKVSDQATYDKLSSGTHYLGPDGHERVKP